MEKIHDSIFPPKIHQTLALRLERGEINLSPFFLIQYTFTVSTPQDLRTMSVISKDQTEVDCMKLQPITFLMGHFICRHV